ncbi:AarF/UbiB family protein [bacterium]|nr:AarF/UbiB family protein [bacterium]
MVNVGQLGQTIQNAKRYQEILGVLFRHGFEDFITQNRLDVRLGIDKGLFGVLPPLEDVEKLPRPVRIRKVLEELGPTFIKLGQVMSVRSDLIPDEWSDELRKLQDDCPRVEFSAIRELLSRELSQPLEELFLSIDETPLAAASMAQVHRAVLRDETPVVLKVLRPGIREQIHSDMEVLAGLAEFVERHFEELGYSATEVVKEFSRELKREVDLGREGRSTDRLREFFRDDERISFPTVFWDTTTKNVLTLSEAAGRPLSQVDPLTLSEEARMRIAEAGTEAVLRQCLELRFFHADPHPGNLFVTEDGKLTFVDCGMTGHIDNRTAEQIADLLIGITSADLDKVITVVGALTYADPKILNRRQLRGEAWDLISRFQDTTLETLDFGVVLQDFFELLRRNGIRLPSDIIFLIKAITTMEGVGEWLAPHFDPVQHTRPFLERLVAERYGFRALRTRVERTVMKYAELAEELPFELQNLLAQIRGNHFSISLEHNKLERLTGTIEYSSGNIALALIVAGVITASSILILAGSLAEDGGDLFQTLGIFGLLIALLGIIHLGIRFFKYGSHHDTKEN